MSPSRRRGLAGLVGLAALLAGCGSAGTAAAPRKSGVIGQVCCVAAADAPASMVGGVWSAYNGWDTALIVWLAPHDAVASQMSALAAARSRNATVRRLAASIDTETQTRYVTLASFANAWGQPAPDPDPNAATGHDHGGGNTELTNVEALTTAPASGFDRLFLTLMIAHHRAALPIAQATMANGVNPQARAFAEELLASQTSDITALEKALGTT